jgi:hypothetical protein
MDFVEIGWGGVDNISLAQDRYRWRALVNVVMNFRVHKMLEDCRMAGKHVGYRVVLNYIES